MRCGLGPLMVAPATIVIFLVIALPTLQLLRYSLNRFDVTDLMRSAFTLENYAKFFSDPYYLTVLATTIKISLLCTVLALVLGFPVAYVLAKSQSRFKSIFIILLVFPLLVGNVVRAAGWMTILGDAGFINAILIRVGLATEPVRLLYTPLAVVLGTTGVVLPYMVLTLQSVMEGLDLSVEEAARNLGANLIQTFRHVVLPMAAPGIAAGTMLVFILCMNAYATPVLLGGNRHHDDGAGHLRSDCQGVQLAVRLRAGYCPDGRDPGGGCGVQQNHSKRLYAHDEFVTRV